MEKLIVISSNDKDINESKTNSNFIVNLKETYNTQQIKRILVHSILVPNVFYNIRDGNGSINNVFKFLENGQTAVTFSIPAGVYSLSEYMTELQTQINTALVTGSVVVSQNTVSKKINFLFTGTSVIIYNFDDGNLNANVAGFYTTTADLANITADSLPDLSGINMVYVQSREVAESHGIDGDYGLINLVDSVSFHNVPFGSFAYKQNNDDSLALIEYDIPRNLKRISIRLRDDQGNNLNIGTSDMTIILKAFF
jgi:hypothetical protein